MTIADIGGLLADTIDEPESSGWLSAGVAVGVILAAIAVTAVVLYLLRKRGREDQD